eukprot:15051002-Alexandrium_andersonii.AAC.1
MCPRLQCAFAAVPFRSLYCWEAGGQLARRSRGRPRRSQQRAWAELPCRGGGPSDGNHLG